jgi:D-sedoheptulose 7-phosphate isomerase
MRATETEASMATFDGASFQYISRLTSVLGALDYKAMDYAIGMIDATWRRGAQVITLGNGGSSMTALHYITDWSKMIPRITGRPFYGRTLVDNMGLVMAYGNDVSFADVFAEQLKNILRSGDLVLAISGSGESENVIRAVEFANAQGNETLGLCGYDGGRLLKRALHAVWIRVNDMQLCEDAHAMFGHIVVQKLCGML